MQFNDYELSVACVDITKQLREKDLDADYLIEVDKQFVKQLSKRYLKIYGRFLAKKRFPPPTRS